MVSKAEVQENPNNKLKLAAAGGLVALGVLLFYLFPEQSLLYRVLGLLALVGGAIYVVYQTTQGRQAAAFFRDARTEVRKVVWPTRAETLQTTLIVMVIVLIMGVFLWLLDWLLSGAFQLLTGVGG
ncbi:MAG TPA: preprotein translocase subunit SecE [Gammaproteobacteria bacterium]|jgi:preprotein translocase subunit SecE|nr:preprotein translocase subunit SecE [Gammaproteobacteria bacterium]